MSDLGTLQSLTYIIPEGIADTVHEIDPKFVGNPIKGLESEETQTLLGTLQIKQGNFAKAGELVIGNGSTSSLRLIAGDMNHLYLSKSTLGTTQIHGGINVGLEFRQNSNGSGSVGPINTSYNYDLGGYSSKYWNDLYLKGSIKTQNATLTLPSSTGTLALTSDIVVPAAPSADGTYVLECTVSSGVATYAWTLKA